MNCGHPLATLWPPTWPPKWPPLFCSDSSALERVVIQKRYPPTYIWLERGDEKGLTLERQRHTGGTPILDPTQLRCAGTTGTFGWSKRWPTGWPMGGHVADDVLLERSIEAFRTCVRRIETFSTVLHPQGQIGRSGYGWSVQSYDQMVVYTLLVCDTCQKAFGRACRRRKCNSVWMVLLFAGMPWRSI